MHHQQVGSHTAMLAHATDKYTEAHKCFQHNGVIYWGDPNDAVLLTY